MFWLAVKGKAPDLVRAELKLRPTRDREEVPEAPVTGLTLPGGWYVVAENKSIDFSDDAVLASLSRGAEVLTCFVEEHVMASEASLWAEGQCVWHISHQSENGIMDLDAVGQLPVCFEDLRTAATTHQTNDVDAEVDYIFDVPVEVAQTLCGFRHDVDPPVEEDAMPLEVLEREGGAPAPANGTPRSKGFWSKLLG